MTENTAVPNEPQPQPADNGPADSQPQYGVRLPGEYGVRRPGGFTPDGGSPGAGGPGAGVPAWHPEANPQQAASQAATPAAHPAHQPGGEDVGRGALFALAVVPLGIIVWMVLWKFGWITSLVTFGAAALAAKLYVTGTGGTLSRSGVWVIASVTAATAVLAFIGGVWLDAVEFLGGSPLAMLLDPEPWELMGDNLAMNPDFVKGYLGDFFMALLFGALGCFFTLRSLFAATRK